MAMRIRSIKPEFWTDSFLVQLEPIGRLMYIALWSSADDHGFLPNEPDRIAMEVMPREDPSVVDDWIQFFWAAGRLELHADGQGHTCYRIASWARHQRVDKPSKSKLFREGSRILANPRDALRALAERSGCPPGGEIAVACHRCGEAGRIRWHRLGNGRPSAWITVPGMTLDVGNEPSGAGENRLDSVMLACRMCNQTEGTEVWIEALVSRTFARSREDSRTFQVGSGSGSGSGKEGECEGDAGAPPSPPRSPGRQKKPKGEPSEIGARVLARINELAGKGYRNSRHLEARIAEGIPESDLMLVVETQWRREYMRKNREYFRPKTLFGPENFEEYLGAARGSGASKASGFHRPPDEDGYRYVDDDEEYTHP